MTSLRVQNPYPIYDQNGQNQLKSIPYLWPKTAEKPYLDSTSLYSQYKGVPPGLKQFNSPHPAEWTILIVFSFLPENLIDQRCSSLSTGQLLKLPIHNFKIQINRSVHGVKRRRSGATGCEFHKQWQKDLAPNEVLQVITNVYYITKH